MAGNWEEEWGGLYKVFYQIEKEYKRQEDSREQRYPSQLFNQLKVAIRTDRLNVNVKDRSENTPVGEAIKNGDLTMLNFLLGEQRADPNIPVHIREGNEEGSAVFLALPYPVLLQEVLQNRGNPNAKTSRHGYTPIHTLVLYYVEEFGSRKNILKCMEILARYGANPNAESKYGHLPLIVALSHPDHILRPELIEQLLRIGANPNSEDENGNTALHLMAYMLAGPDDEDDDEDDLPWDEDDVVLTIKLLLRYGANPMNEDADGDTVVDITPEAFRHIYADFARQEEARNRGKAVRGLVESEKEPLSKLPPGVPDKIASFLTGREGPLKSTEGVEGQMAALKRDVEQGGRRSRLNKKTRRSKGKRRYTKRR